MKYLLIAILLTTAGCGALVPTTQTKSMQTAEGISANHSLAVTRALDPHYLSSDAPPSTTTVRSESSISADSAGQADASSTIPFAVKIAIGGVGLLLIAGGLWAISKSSRVGKAADAAFGQLISMARSAAGSTADPQAKSQLQDLVSEAQKNRGKVKSA